MIKKVAFMADIAFCILHSSKHLVKAKKEAFEWGEDAFERELPCNVRQFGFLSSQGKLKSTS